MEWWLWIVCGLFLIVLELITPGVFFLFFGAAALIVGLWELTLNGLGLAAQLAVFSLLSIVTLLAFRGPIVRRLRSKHPKVDAIIGEVAVAQGVIPADGHGRVELRGTVWSAHNSGTKPIENGERCKVVGIDGITLHVEATNSQ